MTYSTLLAGIDGTGKGFEAAGLTPINQFEKEPRIAELGQANTSGEYIVADICNLNWHRFEKPDVVGVSPVCTRASVGNPTATESGEDIACAEAIERMLVAWRPRIVFLENVWGYRDFKSFGIITNALERLGYAFDKWHLNAADYGVPQTRKRLILVAVREGSKPVRPEPTHHKSPVPNLFGCLEQWRGWYEAIEDLVHDFPDSEFAQWQWDRIGKTKRTYTFLQMTANTSRSEFRGDGVLTTEKPANTVLPNSDRGARAFLFDGANASRNMTVRDSESPGFTISASCGDKIPVRALLVNAQETQTSKSGLRCDRTLLTRLDGERRFTIKASQEKGMPQGWLESGRVVKMTPRALARFQSLPDSLELSGHQKTDCTAIGNAVPSLFAQRIFESVRWQL